MSKSKSIITGIDLGSETIRIAVGEVHPDGGLNILGMSRGPSQGVNKGVIMTIDDTVSSITACVEEVENKNNLLIKHAYVGISGSHIISQESRGIIQTSRPDGEIKQEDVDRALSAAKVAAAPANYDILHVLPKSYLVDSQPGIRDPIGMTGIRLEVSAQIILGLSNQIKNLIKCFNRTGIDVNRIMFSILATAKAVLNEQQKDLGVLVLNLGSSTTSFAVIEEGDILTAKVLPIGSRHITNDIAIGLRIPTSLAEKIKLNYGSSLSSKISKNEQIDYREDLDEKEEGGANRKNVCKIIEARCEEIFKMVNNELGKIDKKQKLPAGVVLTGAGAKLSGLVETAKKVFKIPASIGSPQGFISGINQAFDPSFSTAVGLVLWGMNPDRLEKEIFSAQNIRTGFKKWIKDLLPYEKK